MAARIEDKDRGWRAHGRLMRKLDRGQPAVVVGITADTGGEAHGDSDLTTVEIGALHEFADDFNVPFPQRSFIRETFDKHRAENAALITQLAALVVTGRIKIRRALSIMGLKFQAQIVRRIDEGIPPPLHPMTIARKGSSTPLIDKGQLKQSITFEVEGV